MSFFKKLFGKKSAQGAEEVKEKAVLHEEHGHQDEELDAEKIEQQEQHEEKEALEENITLDVEGTSVKEAEVPPAIMPEIETAEKVAVAPQEEQSPMGTQTEETEETEEASSEDMPTMLVEDHSAEEKASIEEIKEIKDTQEEVVQEIEETEEPEKKKGFMKRLFTGLTKTRDNFLKGVEDVLSNFKQIDEDLYEELEEALIMADFGVDTTLKIMEELRQKVKSDKITDPQALKATLQDIITAILTKSPAESILNPEGPTVILVIGVNGVGKTTSIGKMSHLYKTEGKKVLVAAADTFRAAAIEQLQVWCDRAGVEIIKHEEGTDAAAVVFDAISAAKSRKSDVLICDTAGRLQNKTNLMKELEKISRIIAREYPEAKKEILIALDATTGQNAIQQVKLFKEVAEISGIILTKLDGTAKGGAIVGIYENFEVPVKFIGVGEKIDDLQPFDAHAFATALFQTEQ